MANQAGYFNIQEFAADGEYLVGGRLYTYIYGTTTHKIAYTDADGLVSQTYSSDGAGGFYIALDARGELPAPLYLAAGAYDICLKTAAGATIWTRRADPSGSSVFSVPTTFTSTVTFTDNVTFEENVTIGGDLSVAGDSTFQDVLVEGDLTFGATGDIDLPDGSVDISDLSEELLNLILSGASGGLSGGIISGDGRLSLATGVKVMTSDYAAQGTVYYVGGVILNFNDGTDTFQPFTIGELSQTLASSTYSPAAGAAAKVYDMFAWKRTIAISGITRSSTTATVTTSAAHNITTGAVVYISGSDQSAYNGYHTLTGGSGTTFTFEVVGSPTTPATGSMTGYTATLSRGPFWSSDTSRGTGAGTTQLTLVGSTYTNTVAITNGPTAGMGTYVGSIMTDAGGATVTWKLGTSAASGGEAWLGVWNVSNRSLTGTAVQDTTASWTISATTTGQAMNGSNTWRSTMLCGLNDTIVQVVAYSQGFPPSTGSSVGIGPALDSTSASASRANVVSAANGNATTAANFPLATSWNGFIGLGKHYLQLLEIASIASGSATLYGTNSGYAQSTMYTYSYQ